MTIKRKETNRRMSQAVKAGPHIYIAGQLAYENVGKDITSQTQEILRRIDEHLNVYGANRTSLVSVTVWLEDINDYKAVNEIWDTWVPEGHAPARACVQAKLAMNGYRVEVAAIAYHE